MLERFRPPDHLGSSTTLTDANGVVVARERYSAFGERRRGESSQALITDQLYTDQRYNMLSGLYHYSDETSAGRFYDPLLARFVMADPITPGSGSQGLNRFAYVNGNPLALTDSSGHCADETEFCYKNRWYNARGYFYDERSQDWRRRDTPYFWNGEIYLETAVNAPWVLQGPFLLGFTPNGGQIQGLISRYYDSIYSSNTSLETFARLAEFISGLSMGVHNTFMTYMNWFILGSLNPIIAGPMKRVPVFGDQNYVHRFKSSGFAADDGSNQVNHFWYFVGVAYQFDDRLADALAVLHENNSIPSPIGGGGSGTQQDLILSRQGIQLGNALKTRQLAPSTVGRWLRLNLGRVGGPY